MPAGEVVAIVTGVVACAISVAALLQKPFARSYSYVQNLEQKLDVLVKKAEELKMVIERVDTEPTSGVRMRGLRMWINHTEQFLLSIPELVEQATGARNRSCATAVMLPNCCWRYTVGRKIAEKIEDIDKILLEGRTYPAVNGSLIRENVRTTRKIFGVGAAAAVSEMRRIIVFEDMKVIGVSGMGGAGKTEVAAHFNNQMLQWNMHFDHVLWVEVTHESDLRTLQLRVASKIDLSLSSDNTISDNAAMLMEALRRKGRVLFILDDMWRAFSLEEIGIPEFSLSRGRGCKLVVTSRFSSVCSEMQADLEIELSLLSEDDAYRLLLQEINLDSPEVTSQETQSVIRSIAAECGGLPSAIIATAMYLRKLKNKIVYDTETSEASTRELAVISESTSSLRAREERIFPRLMTSYDRLKHSPHKSIQSCFLYCALYPKNHLIPEKELMEYWMWEGLLGNAGWIDEEMQKAGAILDELKDSRLLESQGQGVKMHQVVRDMAVHISETTHSFFIHAGLGLRKTPPQEMWPEETERASLMRNDLQEFWYSPDCPNLSTMLLQCNPSDIHFCDGFFQNTPELKVLDLSRSGVSALPESLSSLTNLRALILHHCQNLTSLPPLSELELLMALDISYTPVTNLPRGMERLTRLRRLDVSHSRVSCIQTGLLPAMRQLEELYMGGCGFLCGAMSCSKEIENLINMVALEFDFSNPRAFHDYASSGHWRQLKRFKFCVGGSSSAISYISGNCTIVFVGNGEPLALPDKTLELHVVRCDDITNLTIPSHAQSFTSLKTLRVSECSNLKYLFGSHTLHHLPNIEEIVLKSCINITSLTHQGATRSYFPRLRKLTLFDLPSLEQSWSSALVCDSLQEVFVWKCDMLKRFPVKLRVDDAENKLSSPRGLREIRGESRWFESLEWDQENARALIQRLFFPEPPPNELP